MCEHCREDRMEFEGWDPEPDDVCEWRDDDDDLESVPDEELADPGFTCAEPPRFVVTVTFVSEHLCGHHAKNNPELEPDALVFAEEAGLGSSELRPIRGGKQPCEFVDLFGESEECANQAEWAVALTTEYLLCEDHAARRKRGLEAGAEPD